jgi:hypothetical protein
MSRFRYSPKARDIPAVLIAVALGAFWLYMYFKHPGWRAPSGFGPKWQCTERGARGGGPDFCIKKPAADPANQKTAPN